MKHLAFFWAVAMEWGVFLWIIPANTPLNQVAAVAFVGLTSFIALVTWLIIHEMREGRK